MRNLKLLDAEAWSSPDSQLAPDSQHGADDTDDELCLDALIAGVAQELETDGIMVAWHQASCEPSVLFFEGRCRQDLQVERDLVQSAKHTARSACRSANPISELSHHGSGDVLTATIKLADTVVTISGLFRKLDIAGSVRCRAAMARLLPFVQPFFQVWAQREGLSRRLRGLIAAFDNSNVPTFFLTFRGEMLFVNHAARELLAQDSGISSVGGLLTTTTLAETLRLRSAVEHVCSASKDGITPVLVLRRKGRRPLMVTLVPAESGGDDPVQRSVIAYVFDPDQDLTRLIEPACRLYELSPGETRLTCSLTRGASLTEAAKDLGVKEQTARSYLKQIFLKTETNRQVELVGLMLKSAVRATPGSQARVF